MPVEKITQGGRDLRVDSTRETKYLNDEGIKHIRTANSAKGKVFSICQGLHRVQYSTTNTKCVGDQSRYYQQQGAVGGVYEIRISSSTLNNTENIVRRSGERKRRRRERNEQCIRDTTASRRECCDVQRTYAVTPNPKVSKTNVGTQTGPRPLSPPTLVFGCVVVTPHLHSL